MKRIYFAVLLFALTSFSTRAQIVDFTSVDISTQTNTVIDKTLRPTGFLFEAGLGEDVMFLNYDDKFDPYFGTSLPFNSLNLRFSLGYQLTPRIALDLLFHFGIGNPTVITPPSEYNFHERDDAESSNWGMKLKGTYYFSPKIKKGLFVTASFGLHFCELCDCYGGITIKDLDRSQVAVGETFYEDISVYCDINDGDEICNFNAGIGYSWKNFKVQCYIGYGNLEYNMEVYYNSKIRKSDGYSNTSWRKEDYEDHTIPTFGISASWYFNTGYLKFK